MVQFIQSQCQLKYTNISNDKIKKIG